MNQIIYLIIFTVLALLVGMFIGAVSQKTIGRSKYRMPIIFIFFVVFFGYVEWLLLPNLLLTIIVSFLILNAFYEMFLVWKTGEARVQSLRFFSQVAEYWQDGIRSKIVILVTLVFTGLLLFDLTKASLAIYEFQSDGDVKVELKDGHLQIVKNNE